MGLSEGGTCFWKNSFSISLPWSNFSCPAVLKEIHCIEERRFLFYTLLVPFMLPLNLPPPAPHAYFTASWWRESSSPSTADVKYQPDEPWTRQLAWFLVIRAAQEKHRDADTEPFATAVRKSWMKEEKIEGAEVGGNKRKRRARGGREREKERLTLFHRACKFLFGSVTWISNTAHQILGLMLKCLCSALFL